MVVRVLSGARIPLLLGMLLAVSVRLGADDHFRTGGTFQDPFPTDPTQIVKADQRFHVSDPTTASPTHMFISCHGGDTLSASPGAIDVTIPPGTNMTWDTGATPILDWQGAGGAKVTFNQYRDAGKTMRLNVTADFTPITDHFNVRAGTFGFANFTATSDPDSLTETTVNSTFGLTHFDDGKCRIARPPTTFASDQNQSFSAGSGPVAMRPITLTESSVTGNGGIWAAHGIRITIPASLNMTWSNPAGPDLATCTGTAVGAGRISASPTVTFSNVNKTVFIPVLQDFQPSETVVISGLSFASFGGDSSGSLTLNLGASSALLVSHATDTTTKTILGLPTILSNANQVFTVGDPSTLASPIVINESPGSPKINTTDDILITIPNGLNLTFDTSILSVGCSGTAVPTHMANPTNGVTYPGGTGKSVLIPVAGNFSANENVTITGLRYMNFSDASTVQSLTLEVNAAHAGIEDTDNRTIAIGKPTISSLNEQVFIVGVSPVAMAPLTITDDPINPRISNGTQIRIVIPAGPPAFNMTWEGGLSITPVTGLNTSVSYAGGNKTLIVTANAGWTGSATISGLNFVGLASTSLPDNLELWMSSAVGASATSFDDKIIAIGGIPTMTSTTDQQFTVGDAITPAATNVVITDSASPSLQNGRTLQLVIPASLNMTFDTGAPLPVGTPGGGTGTVGAFSFANSKTMNIPITFDFSGSQTLSIGGLRFTSFSAASQPQGLQLKLTVGGPVATTDTARKSIGAPTVSSAVNQTFGTLDPDTGAATMIITEDNGAPIATPRIRNGTDIRIRIPAGFNMQWDTTIVPTVLVGPGAGTVLGTDFPSPQILRLIVGLNFSAGQTVTVSGAVFKTFSGISGLNHLELDVNNGGLSTINDLDDKSIKIGIRPQITGVRTMDVNGNGSLDHLIVTYSEDINGSTTSVTKGAGFVIGGGSYTIALGVQDPFDFKVVTYTLVEKGLPDTGTIPTVRYVGNAGNLTDVNDALKMNTVTVAGGLVLDQASPVIVSFQAIDTDGNGRLDKIVFTFSENIDPTQADIHDWSLIDADGSTNLLLGLTSAEVSISGNTVTLNLANNTGTVADPRYRYKSDGVAGTLADLSGNAVAVSTNNHAPVANAGPDQTFPPTLVVLNGGSSFDPDGQTLSYVWSQTGGGAVTLNAPQTATPNFVTAIPDTYTFLLTVSDGLASTQDFVSITIVNVPPTATAVVNQVGTTGVSVILIGTLSSDINGFGDIASYSWAQIGTPAVVLNNANSPNSDFVPAVPGVYTFELTVTDLAGNSSKDRITVRVHGGGQFVPTADAGPNQARLVGSTVTLDGRLSSTPSGGTVSYLWSPNLLFPGQETSPTPSFIPTGAGLYTFTLVVKDGTVSSAPSIVNLLVYDASNKPPVAVAHKLTPSGNPRIGDAVTLDATGSIDPEGTALVYGWRQTAGPAAYLTNPSIAQPSFTPALSGTYEFQLLVYDGVHISFPARVRFQVLPTAPGSVPITVTATATNGAPPLPNGHFNLAAGDITLTGVSTPAFPSAAVSDMYWEQLEGPAVVLKSLSFFNWYGATVPFTPPVPGRYVFRVYALGFSQLLLGTDDVEVIVDSGVNVAPTAMAGPNQSAMAGSMVLLDGSGSSSDSTRFYWRQVSGAPVQLNNQNTAQPNFVPSAKGTYIFELLVSDGSAAGSKSLVEIDVAAEPQTQASGGSGGGGCGLIGLEPLLLLGLAALAGRARRR